MAEIGQDKVNNEKFNIWEALRELGESKDKKNTGEVKKEVSVPKDERGKGGINIKQWFYEMFKKDKSESKETPNNAPGCEFEVKGGHKILVRKSESYPDNAEIKKEEVKTQNTNSNDQYKKTIKGYDRYGNPIVDRPQ